MKKLWHELDAGMVFRFDDKLYLKIYGDNILSMTDFMQVGLHRDVMVEKVGILSSGNRNSFGMTESVIFTPFTPSLEQLLKKCNLIVNSDLDWEDKYDLVFCDDMSKRVVALIPGFEWYDPDTSYEEDVMAFVSAFREAMQKSSGCPDGCRCSPDCGCSHHR